MLGKTDGTLCKFIRMRKVRKRMQQIIVAVLVLV